MNLYGETSTTYSTPGEVLSYVAYRAMKCISLIGWGDTSAEYLVLVNNAVKGGARSSTETRTVQVWWDTPIMMNPGDTLAVMATHYSQGLRKLRANLMAELI